MELNNSELDSLVSAFEASHHKIINNYGEFVQGFPNWELYNIIGYNTKVISEFFDIVGYSGVYPTLSKGCKYLAKVHPFPSSSQAVKIRNKDTAEWELVETRQTRIFYVNEKRFIDLVREKLNITPSKNPQQLIGLFSAFVR